MDTNAMGTNASRIDYQQAQRHVERKIGFLIHLSVYIIVNIGLILINQITGREHAWPLGPLFFWGLALALYGLRVYLREPGARWKRRMIEQELRKQQA